MQTFRIKRYRNNEDYAGLAVFTVGSGKDFGKPLNTPTIYCNVILCQSASDRNRIEWLCYVLWQAGLLSPAFTKSKSSLLSLDRLHVILSSALESIDFNSAPNRQFVKEFHHLNCVADNALKQLKLVQNCKRTMLKEFTRRNNL